MIVRNAFKVLFHNYYVIIGVIVGVFFVNVSFIELDCTQRLPIHHNLQTFDRNYSTLRAVVRSHRADNTVGGGHHHHVPPSRPRYYSTELGIREQLFVGVLSTSDRLQTHAVHVNRTLAHLVDGVRYFITAPRRRTTSSHQFSGVVAFAAANDGKLAFHVLRHIADNHLHDYDLFLLVGDAAYVNARRLRHLAAGISVAQHVYMGCDVDGGLLLSNSVLTAMRAHLDWCAANAVPNDDSANIERCVYRALQLECQHNQLSTYRLRAFDVSKRFAHLRVDDHFNRAVIVYPIVDKEDFYLLHAYFAQLELTDLRNAIYTESMELSDDNEWPPGERDTSRPATRFDVVRQVYFNRTHVFAADDFAAVRRHHRAEWLDVENVMRELARHLHANDTNTELELVNGYRRFEMRRGVDYVLDVRFTRANNEIVEKRFAVCKPLGGVQFIGVPYVTEASKVTLLLHVEEHDVDAARHFLRRFDANVMATKRQRVLVMFVFLYQAGTPSKGGMFDVFAPLKRAAVDVSATYRSEDTKVAWVSIRLPAAITGDMFVGLHTFPVLRFAAIDLALKKVGVESLLLITNVHADVQPGFLNRVRMNTILNYQVFAPIPYRFYDPQVAGYDAETLEMSKNNGHFDRDAYDTLAFYGKDYVTARKRSKHFVPLTRVDNDIVNVLDEVHAARGNVFAMFVEHMPNMHALRAPDMSLKMRYHPESRRDEHTNWFIGTRNQLANMLLGDITSK